MTSRLPKSALLLVMTSLLAACAPSGPIIVVHVAGSPGAATAFKLSITLNDRPASRMETFAPPATELDLQLPEGLLGQLVLRLDAVGCHDCVTARAMATQFVVGASRYELSMTLNELPAPACPAGDLLSRRWYYEPVVLDRGPAAGQVYIAAGADLTAPGAAMFKTEIYDPVSLTSRLSQPLLTVSAHVRRLHDGRLIMGGGYDGLQDKYVDTTQLYDPMTDRLSLAAPLKMARSGHCSIVLADGRLLMLGGKVEPPRRETATAEIYDPARDQWTLIDSMAHARLYASAVLLANGKVLVSGGIDQVGAYPREVEVFDPAAPAGSQWTSTGNLLQGRWNHSSFVLPNGKVLIVGGSIADSQLETAEIFDPADLGSTATAVAPAPFPFAYSSFVALPDGSVLDTGGGVGVATTHTQIFNPSTGRFEAGPPLSQPRADHASALLSDGSVLLCSGVSGSIILDASAPVLLATERLYPQTTLTAQCTNAK